LLSFISILIYNYWLPLVSDGARRSTFGGTEKGPTRSCAQRIRGTKVGPLHDNSSSFSVIKGAKYMTYQKALWTKKPNQNNEKKPRNQKRNSENSIIGG